MHRGYDSIADYGGIIPESVGCKSGGTRTVARSRRGGGCVTKRLHYTPVRTQAYGELFSTQNSGTID
jgi:hypothetical protein